jgi:flavin reductase (DIM6/NTAB) family NADH-FMN oxidoreductase RutF
MLTINPKEIPSGKMHAYLLGAVTPRPIAFASTIDADGNVNLSPFSFFNCFGSNPPLLIFSPARRGRDNTTKHTFENVNEVPEVVIHIVKYDMVQQMSLSSTEYAKGINEFIKAGFTEAPSVMVKPPRVVEAPVSFECKVIQIIPTGNQGGAGNLVICEVLCMHIDETILDDEGRIDPFKLDAVARLGGDYYCRVQGDSIFKVPKPLEKIGIGVDQLPERIRLSKVLTGNDLGLLANVERIPDASTSNLLDKDDDVKIAISKGEAGLHQLAHEYLEKGNLEQAWQVLLMNRN